MAYSIFGGTLPSGSSGASESVTFDYGIQFKITTAGCQLNGYYWYLPASGNTAGSNYTFRLWTTTTGTSGSLVGSSTVAGSGTWTAGAWAYTPLTPVSLTNGTTYVASVSWGAATYLEFAYQYFSPSGAGSGGITSGPITAPAAATALGGNQCSYNTPSSGSFPSNGSGSDDAYMIDVNVSSTVAGGSSLMMVSFP